jgi:hypothetical protein
MNEIHLDFIIDHWTLCNKPFQGHTTTFVIIIFTAQGQNLQIEIKCVNILTFLVHTHFILRQNWRNQLIIFNFIKEIDIFVHKMQGW